METNDLDHIDRLLEKASKYQMSPAEVRDQIVDYVCANLRISSSNMTREMVEKRATKMFGPRPERKK